ncbi:MAG: protein kinase [Candidatus Hydrogenedentes bacterium]|nr:protein kinase [Candidatus Hydrogenedentota bacterium]
MVSSSGGHASLLGRTFGAYEVFGLIGRGAVGTVYVAMDVRLKRQVALKVLLGSLARDPNVVKTFHREAQAAAPLRHPNIVRIYSAGIEEGTPYIAMEYVEGEPLDRFIRRKGRIKWQSALYIVQQVAEALDCAHARGIVHRDVKPANIMLDRSGRVCLTDFGIANIQTDDAARPAEGGFVGTPHYMSPEQCAGHTLTPSSDLYSLGVTMYQLIAGALPYTAESPVALIKCITSDEAPRLTKVVPDVPDDVSRLAAFLMQKQTQDRPADARAVCGLISRIQAENGGGSALPAALNSFIRDQAQPVALNVVAPTPWRERMRQKNTHKHPTFSEKVARVRWWPLVTVGAVTLGLLVLVVGALYMRSESVAETAVPSPAIVHGKMTSIGADAFVFPMNTPHFRVTELSWVGDRCVVLAEMEGVRGTLAQDASGIVAVDPQAETIFSVRAPSGPALDSTYSETARITTTLNAVPAAPERSPLSGALIGLDYAHGFGAAQGMVHAMTQKWDEAEPRGPVVFQARVDAMTRPARLPWDTVTPATIAIRPDGYGVCVLFNDPETGANYLAEHDLRWKEPDRLGPRLTGAGGRLIPRSVQYCPDGSMLVYVRATGSDSACLWQVVSGGAAIDGTNLTPNAQCVSAAFHPSGSKLAVSLNRNDGGDPEIKIIRADTGAVETTLGRGQLGKESWHCSGGFLVVTAHGAESNKALDAQCQLWAVETSPPYRRKVLTAALNGIDGPCAVSRNGRYAVAATHDDAGAALVFVDLGARFGRLFD